MLSLPNSSENARLARGCTDEALKALRLAKAGGWKSLNAILHDPDLDPIRGDPGFAVVLEEFRKASAPP
jgi:hypothetical protein